MMKMIMVTLVLLMLVQVPAIYGEEAPSLPSSSHSLSKIPSRLGSSLPHGHGDAIFRIHKSTSEISKILAHDRRPNKFPRTSILKAPILETPFPDNHIPLSPNVRIIYPPFS
ncbi:hypothetical protein L3X38_033848 [Prunus dulcis]|uniref:Uncharacterized protein n=1 Tax=Prunus dulcis TaxID=3755 RepID=A0AAD4YXB0_PRUDU|nr:hypothetical protein L3X38_033848 [Prunus dulcis]